MEYTTAANETTRNRFTIVIFIVLLFAGLWMIVKSATAQTTNAASVCQSGDSTQTCLALLDQKAGQIDAHVANTDRNVDSIRDDLRTIDKDITEIKNNEAWERGIWG